jgi:hypothetical protein
LKSPDSRKKKAWIPLPQALDFLPGIWIFLPYDLDFTSIGFENPSMNSVKSCVSRETTTPQLSREAPPHEPRPPSPAFR